MLILSTVRCHEGHLLIFSAWDDEAMHFDDTNYQGACCAICASQVFFSTHVRTGEVDAVGIADKIDALEEEAMGIIDRKIDILKSAPLN
jgi:hypothetical protein